MNAIHLSNLTTAGLNGSTQSTPVTAITEGASGGFGGIFRSATQQVHSLEAKAQTAVLGVLNGSGTEVHEAMIATQKADLAFQLVLQVRNKAVAAYQQMMQMQF